MVTKSEKEQFSDRLTGALLEAGFPERGMTSRLAKALSFKISDKGVRKWLVGEAIPSTDRLPEIARIAQVTTEWLLSGNGPKRQGNPVNEKPAVYVIEEPEVYINPAARAALKEHPELDQLVTALITLAKSGRGDIISMLNASVKAAIENIRQNNGVPTKDTNPQHPRVNKES